LSLVSFKAFERKAGVAIPFKLFYNVFNVVEFEWNEEKNLMNVVKHGLPFETVLSVFDDPDLIVIPGHTDERSHEQRWAAIGAVSIDNEQAVLFIVHVYRGTNETKVFRIISARKASSSERRRYAQEAAQRRSESGAASGS
jgi:hypothetical protein